jgi:hypothetical protein
MHLYDDPDHWLRRAEEMRILAEARAEIETRTLMLKIAEDYLRLAKRLEEQTRARRAGPSSG